MSGHGASGENAPASLELVQAADAHGFFRLQGELDFASVPALYRRSTELFGSYDRITVDLDGVTRSNSAGLALLLEWMEQGRRAGRELSLRGVPERMLNIARASELEDLLPVDSHPPGAPPGGT